MKEAYILTAVRTPIGSFGGALSKFTAVQLGVAAIKGALQKTGVSPDAVDEVFMGNVCSANLGQAPARQAALGAGIPQHVPCTTVNKVCSSGLKSVMLAAQSVMLGQNDIVVAGGMESMSNIPYYIPKARFGHKFGDGKLVDGLTQDGLTDAYNQKAMGTCADATIPQRKGDPIVMTEDEEFKKVKFEKIPALRPAFNKDGTVTAANASTINDGASCVIVISKEKADELGLKPQAKIVSFADAAQAPEWFTTTPPLAAEKALKQAGLKIDDIDFFEVNEAFSVVTMAFNHDMKISEDKVNVYGGSVSLGHPLGASGARILTTLNNVLNTEKGNYGLAAICNGGGGASSMIIQKV